MRQDRLIIGLDFGTTFTGVAACFSNSPEDVEVIKTWPGGNGGTSDKVPTELSYQNGFAWGFDIKPNRFRIRCIKLHLDPSQEIPHFASKEAVTRELRSYNKNPVDASAEYIEAVFKFVKNLLRARYGDILIDTTEVNVVLTVPAMWSHAAKDATLTAAKRAGMGNTIRLISEPEAAACYALKAIQPNHLQIGNNMVVCDAGGGTVDLITYKITDLEPLRVDGVGTGASCGSEFLNCNFEELVKSRLGVRKFDSMLRDKPKTWGTAMKFFEEYLKRNFKDEDEDEEFNVPMPGIPDNGEAGIDSGYLTLSNQDLRNIFEPIVHHVIILIEGQVSVVQKEGGTVSAILLVGGFGQSEYLYERVKEHFQKSSPPSYEESTSRSSKLRSVNDHFYDPEATQPIIVMQPLNAWTAVVRGAVMRGLEGTIVTERRSRLHYGTRCNPIFDRKLHPKSIRYYDEADMLDRARNVMRWYITKNETVSAQKTVSFDFCRAFTQPNFPGGPGCCISNVLYASSADTQDILWNRKSMIEVCEVESDVGDVPQHLWRKIVDNTDRIHWKLDFSLEMRIDSATLEFALKIGGAEYGSATASFSQDY